MTQKTKHYFIFLAVCFFINQLTAQKFNDFAHYREIEAASASSYYKIKLNNELLGKLNSNYSDIRVFRIEENDTIETPYLVNWPNTQASYVKQHESIIDVSYQKNCCSFYTIKRNERREINELFLEVEETDFDKTLKLEASDDNRNWKTIKENIRIVGFSQNNFKFTQINFSSSSYPFYRLTLDDKHSKKININGAFTGYNKNIQNTNYLKDVYLVRKEIKKSEKPKPTEVFISENYSEIKINLAYKACVNSISLSCREKNIDYYRQIAIYDKKGKELFYGSFTNLNENGITVCNFTETNENYFLLKIFNKDNEPLPNLDIKVNGAEAFLYTKLEPEEKYIIAYSSKKFIQQGEYDLSYFSTKMESTSKEIELLKEQAIKHEAPKKKESLITQEKWLWLTLIGLVVLLGLFAFSLMKKVNK